MPRITKGMIEAAYFNLEGIRDVCRESDSPGACWQQNAYSATVNLETLAAAGKPAPEWALRDRKHLQAQGWRFPHRMI